MSIKVAVLGHGVVGSGVAEILQNQKDCIFAQRKEELELAYILDVRSFPDLPYASLFVQDINTILQDESVSVVAECIGGATVAYDLVSACLQAKKNVCTSNKELIATRGNELFALAKENGVNLLYEACVGGGIPVLRPIQTCFGANNICKVSGILNGTTNYILSRMQETGCKMEEALKEAQQKGYAEAVPTADIEGHDAARKISILASMATGKYVSPFDLPVCGIQDVTAEDLKYASVYDCSVKLIAEFEAENEGAQLSVGPCLVPNSHLLAHVNGVQNAVRVVGDMVGETVFYGPGAGKNPTASAVVSDMIALTNLAPVERIYWSSEPAKISEKEKMADYYVRFSGQSGAKPLSCFENVSFLSDPENQATCAVVVKNTTRSRLEKALADANIGLIARVMA